MLTSVRYYIIIPKTDFQNIKRFPTSWSSLPGGEGLVETQEKEGMLTHDASSSVGMALTCGFIFMLLVDQIGGAHGGHSHSHGPGMF